MLGEEINLRALLCASYRLLRAMATHFSLVQKALVPHVPTFIGHTEAALVQSDISPTECISAVYKDNRVVCTQVGTTTRSEDRGAYATCARCGVSPAAL